MAEVAPSTRMVFGGKVVRLGKRGAPWPEGGREGRADEASEVLPLRIELLEVAWKHARIFRWIHLASVLGSDVSQTLSQIEAALATNGKVERDHGTGSRKAHH